MLYTAEELERTSEAAALAKEMTELSAILLDLIADAMAEVNNKYPHDLLSPKQNKANIARMVNQRCAFVWEKDKQEETPWVLSDRSGYFHLRNQENGLCAVLRTVDPVTRRMPKANRTRAGIAYYDQRECRLAGQLQSMSQPALDYCGQVAPDLSDVRLILALDAHEGELDASPSVTAYKPAEPGQYGHDNKSYFSFLLPTDAHYDVEPFAPEADEEFLIPDLIADNTEETEEKERG